MICCLNVTTAWTLDSDVICPGLHPTTLTTDPWLPQVHKCWQRTSLQALDKLSFQFYLVTTLCSRSCQAQKWTCWGLREDHALADDTCLGRLVASDCVSWKKAITTMFSGICATSCSFLASKHDSLPTFTEWWTTHKYYIIQHWHNTHCKCINNYFCVSDWVRRAYFCATFAHHSLWVWAMTQNHRTLCMKLCFACSLIIIY